MATLPDCMRNPLVALRHGPLVCNSGQTEVISEKARAIRTFFCYQREIRS